MEAGGNSNSHSRNSIRTPESGILNGEASEITNISTDPNNLNSQETFKRDANQYMPIANVIKIMRKILPSHAKIADDAKETIQECVTEFIGFITSEANGRCHRDYRITITPEDVISTMGTLGFDNYVEPLTIYLNKIRNQESECNSLQHFPFVKRNVRFVQPEPQVTRVRPSLPRDYVPAPAYPLYPMPSPPRGYAPTQPTSYPFNPMPSPQRGYAPAPYTYPFGPNNYDTGIGLPRMNNDIHDFGGQGGSSSNNLEFDPFMQFK